MPPGFAIWALAACDICMRTNECLVINFSNIHRQEHIILCYSARWIIRFQPSFEPLKGTQLGNSDNWNTLSHVVASKNAEASI